jgi:hypothetical protein
MKKKNLSKKLSFFKQKRMEVIITIKLHGKQDNLNFYKNFKTFVATVLVLISFL